MTTRIPYFATNATIEAHGPPATRRLIAVVCALAPTCALPSLLQMFSWQTNLAATVACFVCTLLSVRWALRAQKTGRVIGRLALGTILPAAVVMLALSSPQEGIGIGLIVGLFAAFPGIATAMVIAPLVLTVRNLMKRKTRDGYLWASLLGVMWLGVFIAAVMHLSGDNLSPSSSALVLCASYVIVGASVIVCGLDLRYAYFLWRVRRGRVAHVHITDDNIVELEEDAGVGPHRKTVVRTRYEVATVSNPRFVLAAAVAALGVAVLPALGI